MNQPLASNMGNALEVISVMELLTSPKATPLMELTEKLGGALLHSAGLAQDDISGSVQIRQAISGGQAAEGFGRMVARMGGPKDFVARWRDRLPAAKYTVEVEAKSAGYLQKIDGRALGNIVVQLGGGRLVGGDKINPAVGLSDIARIGAKLEPGAPLAVIHCDDIEQGSIAVKAIREAVIIGDEAPQPVELVCEKVTK